MFSEFRLTAKVPFTIRFVFHNSIVLMGRSKPWILSLETLGGANQLSYKVLATMMFIIHKFNITLQQSMEYVSCKSLTLYKLN